MAVGLNDDISMKAQQLKECAQTILSDLEKSINDSARLSGYVYDRKIIERMERIYSDEIENFIHEKLEKFQKIYIDQLNLLSEKALNEMTTAVQSDTEVSSKVDFWSAVYPNQPLEMLIKKYAEALDTRNQEFIHFFENNLIHSKKLQPYKTKLETVIKENRKTKIQKETQEELKGLKNLYGFYMQSLEFAKHQGLDILRIQKLFKSLDLHFRVPLKELLPHS